MALRAIPHRGHACVANGQPGSASSIMNAEPPMWRATFDEENTMKPNPVRILALSGSLRRHSFNTALLRAAAELLPGDAVLEIHSLNGVPFYDGDVEDQGVPASVTDLKARIQAADALLLATPEYNYSIAPALKNAIDWASRPYGQSALGGKPAAILGASAGAFGTVRAQLHLREVALGTQMHVLSGPEVFVTHADTKFDVKLRLIDEPTRHIITGLLSALVSWTRQLQQGRLMMETLV